MSSRVQIHPESRLSSYVVVVSSPGRFDQCVCQYSEMHVQQPVLKV